MTILLTAIGSFSADCVISSLKGAGHTVIGCDIYPSEWHPVSKDCFKVYQVPFATNSEDYVNALLNICSAEAIELLLPLTDLEIDVLNNYRVLFTNAGVKLCIQPKSCLKVARNKYEMTKLFEGDALVKTPRTILAGTPLGELSFPAIAKPYNGRSSEGLLRLMSKKDLCLIKGKENYIIQEMLSGNVYTVDYVRDSFGNDCAIPREELLRTKNGAGITVRVLVDENLQKIVSYIGAQLGVIGCVNMEFIFHNGHYNLIDINPRFSAGVAFSCIAGYNMVINHLNAFLNKQIQPSGPFRTGIFAKRYKEEVL